MLRKISRNVRFRWILYLLGVYSMAVLVEFYSIAHQHDSSGGGIRMYIRLPSFDPPIQDVHLPGDTKPQDIKCIGWKKTKDCDPNGGLFDSIESCDTRIPLNESGYCLLKHRISKTPYRVMLMGCSTLKRQYQPISCASAYTFAKYSMRSVITTPDEAFEAIEPDSKGIIIALRRQQTLRAVTISIKYLRKHGCTLPIEVWYSEQVMLQDLMDDDVMFKSAPSNIELLKPFALYHTKFQQVLVLEAGYLLVQNATMLFESAEFRQTGAIFWPEKTRSDRDSLLWELVGLECTDTYEQESGQVLIDKAQHPRALDVLYFYTTDNSTDDSPTIRDFLSRDNDIFRIAWLRTKSTFRMIQKLPGSAGSYDAKSELFCNIGQTDVHHDLSGNVLSLHPKEISFNRFDWSHILSSIDQQHEPCIRIDANDKNLLRLK